MWFLCIGFSLQLKKKDIDGMQVLYDCFEDFMTLKVETRQSKVSCFTRATEKSSEFLGLH